MADMAWITLRVWPWNDAWLAQDHELEAAFRGLDLVENGVLQGAMNGDRVDGESWRPQREPGVVVLSGEMRGGSYEIRETSDLLEVLRERGIAYHLTGDAKYEWDGDEEFWHPGMEEPFEATCGESGRFLTEGVWQTFKTLALGPAEKTAAIAVKIRSLQELCADSAPHLRGVYEEAIERLRSEIARMAANPPEPIPLADQVEAFFAASPNWTPPKWYAPSLKIVEVEHERDFEQQVVSVDLQNRLEAAEQRADALAEALRTIEPLIDAQFEGHDGLAEFMEKSRKLNEALDVVRSTLAVDEKAKR